MKETLEEVRDLAYYKANAEEDYLAVPISVLRYISQLEQQENRYNDMQEYAEFCVECDRSGLKLIVAKDWFEQFKKK